MITAPEDMTETPALVLPMDALSDVLRVARLSAGVFLHAELTAPWCIAARISPEMCTPFLGAVGHVIPYHYVIDGEFSIALGDQTPWTLHGGEIVMFPRNDAHLMGSDLSEHAVTMRDVLKPPPAGGGLHSIRHGKGGATTRLICGFLGCEVARGNPVFETLPAAIRLRIDETVPADWIRSTFQFAANEIAAGRAGSETILAKLSELLFVEAVRRHAQELPPGDTGWFAGLRDPVVARVLALMHAEVARNWSVDDLGREVNLSRSALAERFTRVMGMPPMQYLSQWRMQVAAHGLRNTNLSLARLAVNVGYDSEAAFSRAFRKAFGAAPASWRRKNR
jgi:AraC family transcriptional regulator, alkane utilization regulator